MQVYDSEGENPHDSIDIEKRDARALTECMTVLPKGGDIYTVVSHSGNSYRVDALEGRCTCPDAKHNLDDGELCKHSRRVRFATGEWAIPEWADTDAVDPLLGEHVDGGPRVAASDGGIIEAGDDGEILDTEDDDVDTEDDDEGRPDDCDCGSWNEGIIPCWPCFRDGFETPASDDE